MSDIRVMVFPGAHNLPLWLMDNLEIYYTRSRDEQIQAIQDSRVDIIHTSPDNLLLSDAAGLVPILAGTVGPLELVATQDNGAFVLAVDNPHSGFGRLAYRWLQEHSPNRSYEIVAVGGTPQRFEALKTGEANLAVMHPPFTQLCQDVGYTVLGRIDDGVPTLCAACREEFANTKRVKDYQDSYRRVLQRLAEASGESLAISAMAKNLPEIQAETRNRLALIMRQEVLASGIEFDPGLFEKLRGLEK